MKQFSFLCTLLISINLSAQTWTTYTPPFGDTIGIADIEVVSENIIWAVGLRYGVNDSLYSYASSDDAYYAVTSDGGASWKVGLIPMGPLPFIANIAATDAGAAYVIGLSNFGEAKTLKTVDGGTSWQVTPNNWDPVASWPDYIHDFSSAKATVIGDPRGGEFEIYATANAGQVWVRIDGSHIPDPLSGEFGYNNSGAAVGNNIWFGTNLGRVYHSANSGYDWQAAQTPLESTGLMAFSDASHGLVSSGYGLQSVSRICTTSDGGLSWSELDHLPYEGHFLIFGAAYIPDQPYILIGLTTGGNLSGEYQTWLSPDRGASWQQISTGEIIGWPEFLDNKTGWAGEFQQLSHSTRLFKYTGSPLVGLFTPNTLPADFSISPNPVSESLNIHIGDSKSSDYWLLINDASGKLIQHHSLQNVSNADQRLDLQALTPGLYSLTLSGEKGSKTMKFIKN